MSIKSDGPMSDEKPPIASGWRKLYAFVVLILLGLILFLYLFTKHFE